jgi:branched-chain amino acid transport system substrate-binding protein
MRTTVATIAAASLVLAACGDGGGADGSSAEPGSRTLVVASDLPLRGPSAAASAATNNMIILHLQEQANRAGPYAIEYKIYDNSGPDGSWDDATCARNAQEHVTNTNEVALMGTTDSGCAKIILPVLNQDPSGPMLMVSHANTNPGLTMAWNPGEPEVFYPTGVRNYARVVTTDDHQGSASAEYLAEELGVERCLVIDDREAYGQGVAKAFVTAAEDVDLEVLGEETWDPDASDYTELFERIGTLEPDCLFISGIYDNNGQQLLADKVSVLGDNEELPTMAPDGFVGSPDLLALPEAEGLHLTFPGLTVESVVAQGGVGAELVAAYTEKYGEPPVSASAIYGAAAMQVILAAVAGSDGTRADIVGQVLSEPGITIPADESVLGSRIQIDPETGDVAASDISVLQVRAGTEVLVTTWPVD